MPVDAFQYDAPGTLDEALALLSRPGERVRPLAGGTDLIVQLREAGLPCDRIVDLKRLPELTRITVEPGQGWTIGAAVSCAEIYEHAEITRELPGLIDAASLIGGIQIQNRASLGGNLCNASPAADGIPPLIIHGAVCQLASSRGRREVPVEDFCTGPGQTVLEEGEILVSVRIPVPPPRFGAAYLRFIPRNEMDIAVAGAGASVVLSGDGQSLEAIRVALGAVAPHPLVVEEISDDLRGAPANDETLERAAELARQAARPIRDARGEVWQRVHLAGVLTRRALSLALERARSSTSGSADS